MNGNDAIAGVTVHSSRHAPLLQEAMLAALREGRLPPDFLYASPAQARRWLAYHQRWSPSRTDDGVEAMYREAFALAAKKLGVNGVESTPRGGALVVGVGAGGGRKDAALIRALRDEARGECPVAYAPIDASEALALASAREGVSGGGGPRGGVRAHPLVTDLAVAEAWRDLPGWLTTVAPHGPPRVVSCLGMLPNFDRHSLPRRLKSLLRPGDRLLISANLSPRGFDADRTSILAQYDNPPARAWYAGALEELGLGAGGFRLEVTARTLEEDGEDGVTRLETGEAWIIEAYAELLRLAHLRVGTTSLPVPAGLRLAVFHSQRFSAAGVGVLLSEAGLRVEAERIAADGEEGVFLCVLAEKP